MYVFYIFFVVQFQLIMETLAVIKTCLEENNFWKMSKESSKSICIISLNYIRYMLYYIDKYIYVCLLCIGYAICICTITSNTFS